jgi:hypothetical protein
LPVEFLAAVPPFLLKTPENPRGVNHSATLVVHGDADRILPLAVTGPRTHELGKGNELVRRRMTLASYSGRSYDGLIWQASGAILLFQNTSFVSISVTPFC